VESRVRPDAGFGTFAVRAPLSVSSTIGFVALLGQVSLLGLLVVGRIEERRRAGESLEDAVVAGTADRFRAVLMASLLALLGLLPMAVSRSVGSEIQRPFAVVIVGGMITTLTVVLLVLPMLYAATAAPELRTPEERDEG
jgi:cobalt-zinc-cadmium resistance protein CzcA